MKKKVIVGTLAIILAVVASYILYHNFRAAIIGFVITAIVFPVVFYIVKPTFVWLSIGLAIVVDLLVLLASGENNHSGSIENNQI